MMSDGDEWASSETRRAPSASQAAGSAPLDLVLPCSVEASGPARHALRRWMAALSLPGELVEDAALVVSETVTNAVMHACSTPRLCVSIADRRLRVGVHDTRMRFPSCALPARPEAVRACASSPRGRRLRVVDDEHGQGRLGRATYRDEPASTVGAGGHASLTGTATDRSTRQRWRSEPSTTRPAPTATRRARMVGEVDVSKRSCSGVVARSSSLGLGASPPMAAPKPLRTTDVAPSRTVAGETMINHRAWRSSRPLGTRR
jgi:anti-sigma regulatory factor (Ser/Thr protein kinase)